MAEKDQEDQVDALVVVQFKDDGDNTLRTITGTSFPIPQQGDTVQLTNRNVDATGEFDQEIEHIGTFIVEDLIYEYSQSTMKTADNTIELPITFVTVKVAES